VLAVATDAARRHGLADPVPCVMRFPDAPQSDESAWQELVLAHLDLLNAEVIELRDELDALGPLATAVLREHGVRWPGNAYMHVPVLERARGGSVLTGAGGDELLATRATPRQRLVVAAPRRLREARWRARSAPDYPWLTAAGRDAVTTALAEEEMSWPGRWDSSVRHWHRSRAFAAVDGAIRLIGRSWDVEVSNPFLAPAVLAALARAGGAAGFASRTAAMEELFGDLLPPAVLARETKAAFGGAMWGPAVRDFVAGWEGGGVDPAMVDVELLRREWQTPEPDFRTILLLHAVWMA
jgi:asparagine synthase (glutamine-hydrolysing)